MICPGIKKLIPSFTMYLHTSLVDSTEMRILKKISTASGEMELTIIEETDDEVSSIFAGNEYFYFYIC